MPEITNGRYRHYKGNFYEVIGLARHSETLEEFVVYRPLYENERTGTHDLWIRPLSMFSGSVLCNGETIPRFSRMED